MTQQPQQQQIKEGKSTAIAAYLTFVGTIIAISMNSETKNTFASFHIRQAIGIHIVYFLVLALISGFDSWLITIPFWIFSFVLWAYGFTGALQNRKTIVPLLGEYFQKWFKTIG
ncbi:putative membrane protein [Mesonia hippocampi]|uniref:Putative membrane protein n=1 Tax=Mesonia hippocampi TaxID=1628250 RepID=A0A840EKW4_9FLAO|nr:hypothetical protein [Mesonia hippocampi]MBB4117741.1 putative membrane protein [Mesonia hippocampi]